MAAKKKSPIDIFEILRALDSFDVDVYDKVASRSPEARKELDKNISWMIPRWMLSVPSGDLALSARLFSQDVNEIYYAVKDHPKLQCMLLAASDAPPRGRRRFSVPKKETDETNLLAFLERTMYPDLKMNEVDLACQSLTKADLKQLLLEEEIEPAQAKALTSSWAKMVKSLPQ